MEIQARDARQVEHDAGKDLAVGHHDDHVGREGRQLGDGLGRAELERLEHGNARRLGDAFDLGRVELFAATGGAIRLRDDGDDFALRPRDEGAQARQPDVTCAHENDSHAH